MHTGIHHLQVTMPDNDTLPTWSHSTTAHILCPGLIEVIKFGGCPNDFHPERTDIDDTRIAETTVITFSELLPVVNHIYKAEADPGGVDKVASQPLHYQMMHIRGSGRVNRLKPCTPIECNTEQFVNVSEAEGYSSAV